MLHEQQRDLMGTKRRISAFGILSGVVILLVATAAPATAEVIQGNCVGNAIFDNGVIVTEEQPLSEVVVVPAEGAVVYFGTTNLPPPPEEESFSGSVSIETAMGVSFEIVDWPDPPGETLETSDDGTYEYEVPEWVPRGTGAIKVVATHTQRGQTCIVALNVTLEGDPGAAAAGATAATVLAGAGVVAAGIKKKVK
jgi:hypothetical protein